MSKIRPEVGDPSLRAALAEVGPHIENYQQNLDTISRDIKAVEQYLSSSGVRVSAFVNLGYSEMLADGAKEDVMGNYSGPVIRDVERVEWGPIDDSDRWRLNYFKFRRFGEMEMVEKIAIFGPNYQGDSLMLERKPLIETPVETRIRGHKVLSALVRAVAKAVEVLPIDGPVTDADIPF